MGQVRNTLPARECEVERPIQSNCRSPVIDAARQPRIRAGRLVRRDPERIRRVIADDEVFLTAHPARTKSSAFMKRRRRTVGWRAVAGGCDDNAELISSAHNPGQF